ncbi:AAA family ATPase [Aliidiomarina halalkaliphila]|uniref:AAA family ATPase n=1 Tax=Aliidiomarina halalkaliphila TaxID=2593535 RepID=A0A552WZ18_9GAMM|nr:AAA family ATPase [Aliidiomarina halalkaliphila]TRW48068.1 AAA family ATPase [Aliidiomarina halalkaliphila]
MAQVWIDALTFNDGNTVELAKNDIVVLVGPNNAGKSATLRESAQLLRAKSNKGKVISDLLIGREGNEEELIRRLEQMGDKTFSGNPLPSYRGFGFDVYEGNAKSYWLRIEDDGLSELLEVFVKNISTEERLTAANPTNNIRLSKEPPTHPIHFLQKKDSLEATFSHYFRQAFGTDLIVHRNAGSEVPLYVGERPIPKDGEDRVSEGYLAELETRDLLHKQGDGMRSFVGVLLNAFVSQHSILFIDEPEAFLHPPQARLLGKMLARDLPTARQLFLATHSQDFLKGLLDAGVNNLKIIRVRRDGSVNRVSMLSSADIEAIWKDSLLRHSNVLDGLFHSKVVICESDSDCRFYSAVMSAIFEDQGSIAPDIMFIHCGGKHRIAVVVRALRKLGVPITVVADFDVLSDIQPLRSIVEGLEGGWSELESDWRLVKSSVDQKRPELETDDVKREISVILSSVEQRIFPKEVARELGKILKKTSAWSQAKTAGKSYIPSGDPTQAYARLRAALKSVGLLVVDVGELEGFVRSIGNHGPTWVNDALNRDLRNDPELEDARRFVSEMV